MRLPKLSKKFIAIGAAAGIAMGAAGVATAFVTGTGSASGTAGVEASPLSWTVAVSSLTNIGNGVANPLTGSIENASNGLLGLREIKVTITPTIVNAPDCNVSNFALVGPSPWTVSGASSTTATRGTSPFTTPFVTIPASYYFDGTTGGSSASTVNALTGLSLEFGDHGNNQDMCLGGTVKFLVTVS